MNPLPNLNQIGVLYGVFRRPGSILFSGEGINGTEGSSRLRLLENQDEATPALITLLATMNSYALRVYILVNALLWLLEKIMGHSPSLPVLIRKKLSASHVEYLPSVKPNGSIALAVCHF